MAKNATTILKDNLPKLLSALDTITRKEVLVGVPSDTTTRQDGEMSNATLAYIHDNGAPEANIPARPFMRPGIKDAESKITEQFKKVAKAGLDGEGAVDQYLHRAGIAAQNAIRNRINEGPPPPLKISTVKARARRGRKGARQYLEQIEAGDVADQSLAKPLVDTGQLRNSITYVIREKK